MKMVKFPRGLYYFPSKNFSKGRYWSIHFKEFDVSVIGNYYWSSSWKEEDFYFSRISYK